MEERATSRSWFVGVFALVVCSFALATAFVHWQLRAIDRKALDIADIAAPSIERLATARGDLRHLQALLREEQSRHERGEPPNTTALRAARDSWDQSIDTYLSVPALEGEREIQASIAHARRGLDEAVTRYLREAARGDRAAAAVISNEDISPAISELHDAISLAAETNASRARDLALEIRDLRTRSTYAAFALVIVCSVLAIAGGLVVHRAVRVHADLLKRHDRLNEERASQLDDFAGRVAHDISSPLGTVAFALELARGGNEEQRQRVIDRGVAALARVKTLVSGLLEYARAGGASPPGAHAEVAATIADLVAELEPIAVEAGADLVVTQERDHVVACHPGVLTSLIGNLVRNAIKYLGDASERRIEIRVAARRRYVRVEVEDTGPGLDPTIEKRVFDPYVRAPSAASKPGVGLGLATVKKLAEGHGGRVGVRSSPGRGATFWFELPKANPEEAVAPTTVLAARALEATKESIR